MATAPDPSGEAGTRAARTVDGDGRPDRPPTAPRWRVHRRRAALGLAAVAAVEIVGSVGFHAIEHVSWVNAVYFESMLATGQGPPFALATSAGKIFASVMAFVSVGSTLSAVLFGFGPLLARVWRELVGDVETQVRRLEREFVNERGPGGEGRNEPPASRRNR